MKTTKTNNTQKAWKTAPISWGLYLVLTIITGVAGSVLITEYGFEMGWRGLEMTPFFFIGLVILLLGLYFSLRFWIELIAAAHVRALEVYYGKERAVKFEASDKEE